MALQDFEQRVLDAVADTLTTGDLALSTLMIKDWANHGRFDLMTRLPDRLLWHFGVVSTDISDSTAYTAATNRILNVTRSDGVLKRRCREVAAELAARLDDPYDVNYADKNWPGYYKEAGTIIIKPAPTATETGEVTEPAFAADLAPSTDVALALFPDELEPLLVQYIIIQVKIREMGLMRRDSQDELEAITTSGYLASFESALPTYSAPPVIVLPTLTLTALDALPTFDSSGLQFDPPSMTTLPSFVTQTIANVTALTAPGDITLPTAPSFPTLSLPIPPIKTLAYTSAGAAPSSTVTPGITPVFLAPTAFTFNSTEIDDALAQMKDMMDNSGLGASAIETYIDTDDDLEKAQVGIQALQAEGSRATVAIQNETVQLREYEAELQEAVNRFRSDITQYGNRVQEEVQEVQAGIASYGAKAQDNVNELQEQIAQYLGDINKYQADLGASLSGYQAEVREAIDEYGVLLQGVLQSYQLESGADVAEFRANFDKAIAEAKTLIGQEAVQYREIAGSYIQEFAAKAQASVGEFVAVANSEISEYREQNAAKTREYQAKTGAGIQEYQALVQGEVSEFQTNLFKARSYLEEAGIRLQTMQSFDQKSVAALQEVALLRKIYLEDINIYIKGAL